MEKIQQYEFCMQVPYEIHTIAFLCIIPVEAKQ